MKISHRAGGWTRDGKDFFSDSCSVKDMSWEELTEFLSVPVHVPRKKNAPMWLAGDSTGGCKNENVRIFSAAVFDLDGAQGSETGMTQEDFDRLLTNLEKSGVSCIVHGSYKFSDTCIKIRLVIKLSRDISVKEWAQLRPIMLRGFEFEADEKTKNPGRWYFVPNIPLGAEYYFETFGGDSYDVDVALALDKKRLLEKAPKVEPDISVDMADLMKQVRNMDMPLAATLEKGLPLGVQGSFHDTIHKTAARLTFKFGPTVPESAIYQLMLPSLEQSGNAEVAKEHALASLQHVRRQMEDKLAEEAEQRRLEKQVVIAEQAKNAIAEVEVDEHGKYTEAQVQKWADEAGCTLDEFMARWIIHKGDAYFIFVDGEYKPPVGPKELANTFKRDFARAPIDLTRLTAKKKEEKIAYGEILNEYGTAARFFSASLALQKSFYDAKTQTFHEAVVPLRPIKPAFDPLINEFLKSMGETVYNWCSVVTRLDKQCALLYIHAPPNIGKTLLANGISTLWSTMGPTPMQSYVKDFNSIITHNPFIFADEKLPEMSAPTAFARQNIGSTFQHFGRKYMPDSTIHGCPRFMVCANNANVFDSNEELTTEDLAAFIERIAYVHISGKYNDPGKFIADRESEGFNFDREWLKSDRFAAHLLWMRDNHTFKHGRRYLVEGFQTDFHQKLVLNTGFVMPVCEWIIRFIETPKLLSPSESDMALVGEKYILINIDALSNAKRWDTYCASVRAPPAVKAARALGAISNGSVSYNGRAYSKVSTQLIYAASRQLKLSSFAVLSHRISEANPKVAEILQKGVHDE